MQLDPNIVALVEQEKERGKGGQPLFDSSLDGLAEDTKQSIDRRKRQLTDAYVWGLLSPLPGIRETYAEKATKEVQDQREREFLIQQISKYAKMQEWAQRSEYAEKGFTGRFMDRIGKVGAGYAAGGGEILGAVKDWAALVAGKNRSAEDVRFLRGMENAKQLTNPDVPDEPLLKSTVGFTRLTPSAGAGMLATVAGGPAGLMAYVGMQNYPKSREDFLEAGLDPVSASFGGAVVSGAVAAIEATTNLDPTGYLKKGPVGKGLRKAITEPLQTAVSKYLKKGPLKRVAKGAADIGERYVKEALVEESLQAGVEEGGLQIAAQLSGNVAPRPLSDIPKEMLGAARGAAGPMAIGALAGVGGKAIVTTGKYKKRAVLRKKFAIQENVLEHARSGKVPSRSTWKGWGLKVGKGEEGSSRIQRGAITKKLASDIQSLNQVQAIALHLTPTNQQWADWGFPEEYGITEESKREFLFGWMQNGKAMEEKSQAATEAVQEPTGEAVSPEGERISGDEIAQQQAAQAAEQAPVADGDSSNPKQMAMIAEEQVLSEGKLTHKAPGPLAIKVAEMREIGKDIKSLISPAHVEEATRKAGHILRAGMARAAQQIQAATHRLNKLQKYVALMSPEARVHSIMSMDEGLPQETKTLETVAKAIDEELVKAREVVQTRGKLQEFYENYFPHLWRHRPGVDLIYGKIMRKPFAAAGFLKKRKYPTIRGVIEDPDNTLELITDNPIDLALTRIRHMYEYVAKLNSFDELKHVGLARFVPASFEKDYTPAGYDFPQDSAFAVQTTGGVTVTEAYDRLLFDQLISVANAIGVSHKRVAEIGKTSHVFGETDIRKKGIKTKIGAPIGTIAHEIGHQIGAIFDLHSYMVENDPIAEAELRGLAQLRYEEMEAPESFRKYVETPEELEAILLEAWLLAPEKMAQAAPNVTRKWKEFLEAQEPLQPLLMLNRSLVLGTMETEIEQPGIRTLGRWAVPTHVAKMINNQLSPGFRRSNNIAVKTGYDLLRNIGNSMNQASLSMSLFHGLNVMTDAVASQHALGLQQLQRGKVVKAARNILGAFTYVEPGAKALFKGSQIKKIMNEDFRAIPNQKLIRETEDIILSGGYSVMDSRYHNHSAKAFGASVRSLIWGTPIQKVGAAMKTPVQLIFAGLEATAWPVMQWLVPRLKLGVHYYMLQDIYARADVEGLSDFQIHEQMTQAWDSVDNRMGQLAYNNLFWNQYLKDASMLAVRSVGWNLGSIREYGGAIIDPFTFRQRISRGDQFLSRKMAYAIGAIMTYAPLGAILQFLLSGEPPEEPKDLLFPRTGRLNRDGSRERLSLPTYAKDWFAWGTDPGKTILHKLHPIWGTISEVFITNEDYFGAEIRNSDDHWMVELIDSVKHVGEAFIPFSVRNFKRMEDAGEPIGVAALLAAMGISSAPGYITRTRAQKLAYYHLAGRFKSGKSRTKKEAAEAKHRGNLLHDLRSGESVTEEDLEGLTVRQRNTLFKNARLTPFQSMFKRLAFNEAMDVYNVCDEEERKQVKHLMVGKRSRAKGITPDEARLFSEIMR